LLILLLGVAVQAHAETSADIDIYRESLVIWSETSLGEVGEDSTLQVDIVGPRRNGRRALWQRCTFPVSDGGPYRCGVEEKAARKQKGGWITRAFVDDELIGRQRFWVG
jgi:hypothetical protein